VETSYIESVIRIASVLMNCDYLKKSFSLIAGFFTLIFSEEKKGGGERQEIHNIKKYRKNLNQKKRSN